jgi:acyl carrier protein
MGLDTVDLIIAVEKEFKIQISDQVAPKLAVLGDLLKHVIQVLEQRGENPDQEDVWRRLSAVVVEQLGVRPEEVTRASHIVDDLGAD